MASQLITDVLSFDRDRLFARLEKLPPGARVAFALACTTRLGEAWRLYIDRKSVVGGELFDQQLDRLWSNLLHGLHLPGLAATQKALEALAPAEPATWDPYPIYAADALSALVYTFEALQSENAMFAAWAGQVAFDACDQVAVRQLKLQRGQGSNEDLILAQPVVQRELERQERDLRLLEQGFDTESINALRSRVASESSFDSADIEA